MKKTLIYLTIITIGFILFSCEKDETRAVLRENTVAPVISTPANGSTITLNSEIQGETVMFIWSSADFGVNSPVDYVVEIDTAGNQFSDATELGSVTGDTLTMSIGGLNRKLLDLGLPEGVQSSIELRVRAVISPNVETAFSEVATLNVTPYSTEITVDPIYLVGDGSEVGWNNASDIRLNYTGTGGVFVTYASLVTGKYIKFLADSGAWAPQWGNDGSGTSSAGSLVYRARNEDPDPPSIPTPAEDGIYKITADTALLTYEIEEFNLGIVGSATPNGWDGPDTRMTYNSFNDVWTLTTDLTTGEMKFRLNDNWSWNLGGTPDNLVQEGSNIAITEAGNYTITLDLSEQPYTFEMVKN